MKGPNDHFKTFSPLTEGKTSKGPKKHFYDGLMTSRDMGLLSSDKPAIQTALETTIRSKSQNIKVMKSSITFLFALMLMVGTTFANTGEKKKSGESAKVAVIKWKPQVHQLFYEGTDKKVIVRILNDEGIQIWRSLIRNQKGFALPLNFKKQEAGNYSVEVRDSKVTYIQEIQVSEE